MERNEITIAVQEGEPILNTPCRYKRVNRLAHRYPAATQHSEVFRRLHGNIVATNINLGKGVESSPNQVEFAVILHTLQNFRHDQIPKRKDCPSKHSIQ